jgi:hypothetical protein
MIPIDAMILKLVEKIEAKTGKKIDDVCPEIVECWYLGEDPKLVFNRMNELWESMN